MACYARRKGSRPWARSLISASRDSRLAAVSRGTSWRAGGLVGRNGRGDCLHPVRPGERAAPDLLTQGMFSSCVRGTRHSREAPCHSGTPTVVALWRARWLQHRRPTGLRPRVTVPRETRRGGCPSRRQGHPSRRQPSPTGGFCVQAWRCRPRVVPRETGPGRQVARAAHPQAREEIRACSSECWSFGPPRCGPHEWFAWSGSHPELDRALLCGRRSPRRGGARCAWSGQARGRLSQRTLSERLSRALPRRVPCAPVTRASLNARVRPVRTGPRVPRVTPFHVERRMRAISPSCRCARSGDAIHAATSVHVEPCRLSSGPVSSRAWQ